VSAQSSGDVPCRLGVMGGTFDPIHHGHLVMASEVVRRFELDEMVFVPTGQPWQKSDSEVTDAEDRYAMTVLATAAHPRFRVSRIEIDRPGATYTVDTLRELRQQRPRAELFFVTGADTLANVSTWKAVDEVFTLAKFIAVNRPGFVLSRRHLPVHAEVTLAETPALDISSTGCRARVAAGEPIWYLTPDAVVRYIRSRGLYRDCSHDPA
jgi:nicotinate-nucleotide adenylyltransferase